MSAEFYRAQAALCFRLARTTPQERIAREMLSLATEYDSKATELESANSSPCQSVRPRLDISISQPGNVAQLEPVKT